MKSRIAVIYYVTHTSLELEVPVYTSQMLELQAYVTVFLSLHVVL